MAHGTGRNAAGLFERIPPDGQEQELMNEFENSNKQQIRKMSTAKKLQYFKDYYLLKVVVILGAAAVLVYGLYSLLKPKPNHILTVVILDNVLEDAASAAFLEEVKASLSAADARDEVLLLADFSSEQDADMTRLSVMASAGEVDAVIAPESVFANLAAGGFYLPLRDVFGEEEISRRQEQNAVFETAGFAAPEAGADAEVTGAGDGEVLPYGIRFENCTKWQAIVINPDDAVFGVAAASNVPQNAAAFARILLEEQADSGS